jgi:hypothetical protein
LSEEDSMKRRRIERLEGLLGLSGKPAGEIDHEKERAFVHWILADESRRLLVCELEEAVAGGKDTRILTEQLEALRRRWNETRPAAPGPRAG